MFTNMCLSCVGFYTVNCNTSLLSFHIDVDSWSCFPTVIFVYGVVICCVGNFLLRLNKIYFLKRLFFKTFVVMELNSFYSIYVFFYLLFR